MRTHILSETKNILKAQSALAYLLGRPVHHQPGLGMIFGHPGLGKTQFSQRTCIRQNYVYYSAKKSDTGKSFIASLSYELMMRYRPADNPRLVGSRATLFNICVDLINEYTTDGAMPVIFIDEVDNIIHKPHEEIVGMLRDIVDNTAAVVMLVGMQDLRQKIVKLNAHYYNRVVYFCEFKRLEPGDVRLLIRDLCEVTLDSAIIKQIIDESKGDARKVIKHIRLYEETALKNGLHKLSMPEFEKLVR